VLGENERGKKGERVIMEKGLVRGKDLLGAAVVTADHLKNEAKRVQKEKRNAVTEGYE